MSKWNFQVGLWSSSFKSWILVGSRGTGTCPSLDTIAPRWRTLDTTGDLVEDRGGDERTNHEVGHEACSSANSCLSGETILARGAGKI